MQFFMLSFLPKKLAEVPVLAKNIPAQEIPNG